MGREAKLAGDFRGFQFSSGTRRRGKRLAIGHSSLGSGVLALSPDYHRRQATALTHLAETTSDPDAAKALLRIASEHIVCADEAERTLALASMKIRTTSRAASISGLVRQAPLPAFGASRHLCFSSRRDRGSIARSGRRHPKTR